MAGVGVGVEASLIPRPSPSTLACASYAAWIQAQPGIGPPGRDPSLLTDAAQEDQSGQLGTDLATLQSDVGNAIAAPSGEPALGAQAIVLSDMSHLDGDCRV